MHSFHRGSVLENDVSVLSPHALTPIEWVQFAEDMQTIRQPAAESQMVAEEVTATGLINGMRSHCHSHQLTAGAKLTEAEAEQLLNADIKLYGEVK